MPRTYLVYRCLFWSLAGITVGAMWTLVNPANQALIANAWMTYGALLLIVLVAAFIADVIALLVLAVLTEDALRRAGYRWCEDGAFTF